MNRVIFFFLAVFVISIQGQTQGHFEAMLILRNSVGQVDTLYFGVVSGATRYLDTTLGEVNILNDTLLPNQFDARFTDRFMIYGKDGKHQIDSNGQVKMGVSPVTFESKRQLLDPWSDSTEWYLYYEINIINQSWPLEISATVVLDSLKSDLSPFVLTTWADASRWFDVDPKCGSTKRFENFIDGNFHKFESSDFCRLASETSDTLALLFIGITGELLGSFEVTQPISYDVTSNSHWFEMSNEVFKRFSDWCLVDVLGKQHSFTIQLIDDKTRIVPTNNLTGIFVLYSAEGLKEGFLGKKAYLTNAK